MYSYPLAAAAAHIRAPHHPLLLLLQAFPQPLEVLPPTLLLLQDLLGGLTEQQHECPAAALTYKSCPAARQHTCRPHGGCCWT
jgi:hypothetical protein